MENGPSLTVSLDGDGGGWRRPFTARRRNRRGRGLRGDLLPADLPGHLTRSEQFEQWVSESAERLEYFWGERIEAAHFVVEDIPPHLEELLARGQAAPLGSFTPAAPGRPAVVTVFRHPVQMAVRLRAELPELIHDVVVEQTAQLLNMAPEAVDPGYGRTRP